MIIRMLTHVRWRIDRHSENKEEKNVKKKKKKKSQTAEKYSIQ